MVEELSDAIKNIELTDEGKKPQKEMEFVTDSERARVLDDTARLQILTVLKNGVPDTLTITTKDEATGDTIIRQREVQRHALSVVEMVKLSSQSDEIDEVTKNQVYHHLPKLIEAGYVIKYGTVTTGGRTTDYYRRTAKGFVLAAGDASIEESTHREKAQKYVERMCSVFDLGLSDEERKKLVSLSLKSMQIAAQAKSRIARMVKGDVVDPDVIDMYDWLLQLYLLDNAEWTRISNEMRSIVFSQK
jgi:DNA-binding transcriptional ArsR family regulator